MFKVLHEVTCLCGYVVWENWYKLGLQHAWVKLLTSMLLQTKVKVWTQEHQTHTIRTALEDTLMYTHTMSNITPKFRATQSLLHIVLETKPLVFASLKSDRRQIVVCQHPVSAVQCKQPQVTMQTIGSDHMAAGSSAVCLSHRLVQSALAL